MQSLAMLPMMTEETADSKFSLLLEWNVVINFAILKSLWVLAIVICSTKYGFLNAKFSPHDACMFG